MARVRLGELLLSRGICSREQLSHAWEQKIVYGDRLGTSLLALGYVDEPTIAAALGQQFGVHGAHGGNICVDPNVVPLVPAATATKRQVLPHTVVDGVLYLLMVDPDNQRAIDEVTGLTRLRVQPVVVCEARMWTLLSQHHHAVANQRPNPLIPTSPAATTTTAADLAGADDLLSESDFNDMYARLAQKPVDLGFGLPELVETFDLVDAVELADDDGLDAGVDGPASLPTLQPLTPSGGLPEGVAAEPGAVALDTAASWQRPAPPAHLRSVGLLEIAVDEVIDGIEPRSPFSVRPTTNTSQIVSTIDWSPITFTDAAERLKLIKTREDIARVVLRAARSRFSRACLLTVYPHAIVGWYGVGEGYEGIADVVVRRDAPSVFDLVANSGAHSLGPLQRFPAHGAWVKATGKRIPRSVFVMPILVRGQTVSLLVADNGHDADTSVEVGELLILAQHIALSFESLIEQE